MTAAIIAPNNKVLPLPEGQQGRNLVTEDGKKITVTSQKEGAGFTTTQGEKVEPGEELKLRGGTIIAL